MYKFSFRFVSLNKISEAVNKLNPKNTHRLMIDRSKLLKKIKTLLLFYVSFPFINALSSCSFPAGMKYADAWPAFKKDDKTDKENYRPISILLNLSEVNERLRYDQMYPFFD